MVDFMLVGPAVAIVLIGAAALGRHWLRSSERSTEERDARIQERAKAPASPNPTGRFGTLSLLVHAINDDRCTGCDACVVVCPTSVLELHGNKSRVVRLDDCIQCRQCEVVCPTQALVMHFEEQEPRPVLVANLDRYGQAVNVPGLYLVGEAAGRPLVKNAVNLGRAAVESIVQKGLRPGAGSPDAPPGPAGLAAADVVDVVIVGSGPGGLSAALACLVHGLSYVIIERDVFLASTIARYPKGKSVMAEPTEVRCVGLLPVWDASKEALIAEWNRRFNSIPIQIRLGEPAEEVTRTDDSFLVRTTKGRYRGQRLILAIGGRGKPRRLSVPGEDLAHVHSQLDDAALFQGQDVLVIGGGDSAVEAAVQLAQPGLGNRVRLSYRRKQFTRIKQRNRQALEAAVRSGRIQLLLATEVAHFTVGNAELRYGDGRLEQVPSTHAFVLIGGDPAVDWLKRLGIEFSERPFHDSTGRSDLVVEELAGPQLESGRPGSFPGVATVDAGAGSGATIEQDMSAQLSALSAAYQASAESSSGAILIQLPREELLLQLPEKAVVTTPMPTIRELRHGRPSNPDATSPSRRGDSGPSF